MNEPGVKIGDPTSLVAVVPYLMGYIPPVNSLVTLGVNADGRVKLAFRYEIPVGDLVGENTMLDEVSVRLVQVMQREEMHHAVLIGYGARVDGFIAASASRFEQLGITVGDVIRVHGNRIRTEQCGDTGSCCAGAGHYIDPDDPAARKLAATMGEPLSGPEALVATIARDTASAGDMEQATAAVLEGFAQGLTEAGESHMTAAKIHLVHDAIERYRRYAGDPERSGTVRPWLDNRWLAEVSVAMAELPVRDNAWARMDPKFRRAHRLLWTDVTRHALPEYVAPAASMLAFVAWQDGDGAVGLRAIDRALEADPEYTMALLLQDALLAGLPPSAATAQMTPDQVDACYELQRNGLKRTDATDDATKG